jgi:hypothetical protein
MRGTIGGKRDEMMDARMRVNCAVEPSFEVSQRSSHTLQNRSLGRPKATRTSLSDATAEVITGSSHPRLHSSRAWR